MAWTLKQIHYLETNAGDGAKAIACALGKSERAVRVMASRRGVSLRSWFFCPNCGKHSTSPLNSKTGWCSICTKELRAAQLREELLLIEEELKREEDINRERQALYTARNRAKKIYETKMKHTESGVNDDQRR